MSNLKGGGLLLAGIVLVIVGVFVQSGILEWLLDIIGFVVVALGVILGIVGLIQMLSGGSKSSASDY
jgi:spore maturation protein SpmB